MKRREFLLRLQSYYVRNPPLVRTSLTSRLFPKPKDCVSAAPDAGTLGS